MTPRDAITRHQDWKPFQHASERLNYSPKYFPDLVGQNHRSGYVKIKADRGVASFAVFGTYDLQVLSAIPAQVVP